MLMWFKNLRIYRVSIPSHFDRTSIEDSLARFRLPESSSLDLQNQGWVSPLDNDFLVQAVGKQFLISLGTDKKLLPASVINQFAKAKATEITEQQGFAPGRKQLREIKEEVRDQLLPRAFVVSSKTNVWIDAEHGWLVINTTSPAKADEVIKLLLKSIDKLVLAGVQVIQSPVSAMTQWLQQAEAPFNFSVDSDMELVSTGENKSRVKYVKHTLENDDVRQHIAGGKQCSRLAVTWNDRISFELTDSLCIKKICPLDVMNESVDKTVTNADERFDSDFTLMTGELNAMLDDLLAALGGEKPEVKAA
jgi:recombination associated protein RdgC